MKVIKFKEIVAIFLVLLFVYTASSKLLEHSRFIFQLQLSPLSLIRQFAKFLSFTVPLIELAIALLLMTGIVNDKRLNTGLWVSLILMIAFETYITLMLVSGKDLPCACGGIISLMSWRGHELFNGLIIILIVVGLTDLSAIRGKAIKQKYSRV
jgi:hypothetical protein